MTRRRAAVPAAPARGPSRALVRALGAGVAVALAGCAGLSPAPPASADRPQPPPAWIAPLPAAGDVPLARWWLAFPDPALPAVVDAALEASPDVASAAARIERARAAQVAAGAALLPRIDAVAAAQQGRQAPAAPQVASAQLGVQAGWEIDLFGRRSAEAAAARARLAGAAAQAQGVRAAVAAEAATQLINLRGCEALVRLARADAESRGETARLTALTARSGFSAPADAALADAGAAQARALAVAQQAACDAGVKALVELTGWDEAAARQRLKPVDAAVPLPGRLALPAVPAELLRQRPDLIDAEASLEAAAADRSAAHAATRPQLQLAGQVAIGSARTLGVTQSGSTWTLGPLQLTLPLFDAGARRANVDAARAEYHAAVARYQGLLRRAVREVEQALVAIDASQRRGEDTARAADGFDAALRAADARRRGGLASQFELEDARRNAVAARRAVIQLQQETAVAWIDLARALGGGWSATDLASRGGWSAADLAATTAGR